MSPPQRTQPHMHSFNGWFLNTDTVMFAAGPTLTQSRVTWSADTCMDHPEPARGTFLARAPRRVAEVLALDLGSSARAFVSCWGKDPGGSGAVQYTTCAYMEGYIDQVTKRRLKYKAPNTDPTRRPYHAVPVQYRLTSTPPTGLAVELYSRTEKTATLTSANWSPSGKGAQRVRIVNGTTATQNVAFQAVFDVTMGTERIDDTTGASGTARAGDFMLAVTQKDFMGAVTITYGGSSFSTYGTVTLPSAPGLLTVGYSLTVPAGGTAELIPAMAQTSPAPSNGDAVELTIETSDALAKLGRVYVGDEPWYVEAADSRIAYHLGPAAAKSGINLDFWPYRDSQGYEPGNQALMGVKVRKLDVDNRSALEVYQRTVAAAGRVALGLAGRVGISWALQPALKVNVTGGVASIGPSWGYLSTVQTNSLRDEPLRMSTEMMANRFTFEYMVPTNDGTNLTGTAETKESISNEASVARYGSVNRTLKSDLYAYTGTYGQIPQTVAQAAPNLWSKAQIALDAQCQPMFYLDGDATVIARDIEGVIGLAELVDNSQRYGRLVQLDGALPPEISPYQRQRGGSFGFGADGKWHLEMKLEPSDYSGVEAGRYQAITSRSDLKFNAFKTSAVRLGDLRNAAF